jgi:hypothetical protein
VRVRHILSFLSLSFSTGLLEVIFMRSLSRVSFAGLLALLAALVLAGSAFALTPGEISRMGARTVVGWNYPHGANVQILLRLPFYDRKPNVIVNDCNFGGKGSTKQPKKSSRVFGWINIGRTKFTPYNCAGEFAWSQDYTGANYRAYVRNTRLAFKKIRHAINRDFNRGQVDPNQRIHIPLKGIWKISSLVYQQGTNQILVGTPVNCVRMFYRASSRFKDVSICNDACGYVTMRAQRGWTPPTHPPYCGRILAQGE